MVIHPILSHFPVALLTVGTLALVVGLLKPTLTHKSPASQQAFEGFVNGVMGLGYAGLILTIATGLFDMQASPKSQVREGWLVIAVLHILIGVSLLVVYGFLFYRRFVSLPPSSPQLASNSPAATPQPDTGQATAPAGPLEQAEISGIDWLSLALALLGLLLLVTAGWLGGMLVYEYRVGIG
jgi:uncharacterized membrane protein